MSRRPTQRALAATLSLLLVLAGSAVAASGDDSVTSDPGIPVIGDLAAIPTTPDPNIVDPRPSAWHQVVVRDDGVTLDVYFWGGIEDCYGLHSVQATPTDSGVDLQLLVGMQPDLEPDTACIEIAVQYVTTITLEEPLISQPVG